MLLALVVPTYLCRVCVCLCVFVCLFIKLYIVVGSDPVIQDSVCHIGPLKRGSIILVTKIYDHMRLRGCV